MSAVAWIREQWSQPMARYPAVLALYLCIIAFSYGHLEPRLWPIEDVASRLTAGLTAGILDFFGASATASGALIQLDGFTLAVIGECLGTLEIAIFSAFVLAYPTDPRAKAWGLCIGPLVIYLMNLIRLVSLVLVGRYLHAHFELLHVYFWQSTFIAIIAVTWLAWLRVFVRE